MKLPKFFNKISVKIAFVITILIIVLIMLLYVMVVNRGERVFADVYQIIQKQGQLPSGNVPFMSPPPQGLFSKNFPQDTKLTPQEHFKDRFQSSLVIIVLAVLAGAVGIGWLTSRIIAKPLNTLSAGMKKLRQNHYQLRLEEKDSEEFKTLIQEFNMLAGELHHNEELRKNLISDTSHELKTPLASLTAQLEGIEDGVLSLDKERIALLKGQVSRLSELTEGLQEYASLRSQAIRPKFHDILLKDVIRYVMEYYKNALREKNIEVRQHIDDVFTLRADRELLERVFSNLFENAIRYSSAQHIIISIENNRILFADDGVGIPKENLSDIFERFFRIDKSRDRKGGGMGLGLAIVKEIITAHGWKIHAEIPENGKGVAFVITL